MKEFDYYYNTIPIHGRVRNNLVYTSLISKDKKTFCQWFHNDTEYHQGKNQIIDSSLMEEKWLREIKFLTLMSNNFPQHIPEILDIDYNNRKIYLKIDGVDFWQRHYDNNCNYDNVLIDWQQQHLEIFKAHISLNLYKISLHPSSYFIVDGKLKNINYFFCHHETESMQSLKNFKSHISEERQQKLNPILKNMNHTWESLLSWNDFQIIALESFRSNYPDSFINQAINLYDKF
jgi:hypothetical protein